MKKSRRTYNGVHLNKKSNTQDVVEQSLTNKKSSSSKLQSNSVEVRGTTLKKSLDHTTPDDSVLQHGLDPFRYKTSPVSIDSFYKEESGRSYSSLPKDINYMNVVQ